MNYSYWPEVQVSLVNHFLQLFFNRKSFAKKIKKYILLQFRAFSTTLGLNVKFILKVLKVLN